MKKNAPMAIVFFAISLFADESFGGIGLVVQEKRAGLSVESIIPNTPAAESELKADDLIVSVDGRDVENLPFEQSVSLFRGVENKPIDIAYISGGDTLRTTLRRVAITTKRVSSINSPVDEIKGKKFVSIFEFGAEDCVAIFLESSSPFFRKNDSDDKGERGGLRLLQIRGGIISYEKGIDGKTFSTDLNGKLHNK